MVESVAITKTLFVVEMGGEMGRERVEWNFRQFEVV